jgi:molybdopterin-guanine dinucleotide biosynthesis protein A
MSRESKAGVEPAVSAIVLSGGRSKRLGADKALLLLDGQPLLARTIETMATLSDDLIVVTNDPESHRPAARPARLVPDVTPGIGSLMGIYSGLRACRHPQAIVVACDMPFLSVVLLRYMISLAGDYDVVIPRQGRWFEPLHAIYGRNCLPAIEQVLASGQRQIVAFFDDVRVRYVDEEELDVFDPHRLSFLNVNTSEDWELIARRAAGRGEGWPAVGVTCR